MFSCSFQVVWITGASRGIGMRVFNLMYCETMTNMISNMCKYVITVGDYGDIVHCNK